MRKASNEPRISDSARWLGMPSEPESPIQWWDGLIEDGLPEMARVRLGSQLHYLVDLGIRVDRHILRAAIAEAVVFAANSRDVDQCDADEIIYYLRIGPLVKVGYTTCYANRIRNYPPDAVLLANEPGDRALETERHHQFRRSLARGREWFYPTADLIEHINSLRDEPLKAAELAA